jgi:hypothetical protein
VTIAAASSHGVLATFLGHLLEATGDHNKAALLAMTRFMAKPKYAGIQQARDDEVFEVHGYTQVCVSHTTSSL